MIVLTIGVSMGVDASAFPIQSIQTDWKELSGRRY